MNNDPTLWKVMWYFITSPLGWFDAAFILAVTGFGYRHFRSKRKRSLSPPDFGQVSPESPRDLNAIFIALSLSVFFGGRFLVATSKAMDLPFDAYDALALLIVYVVLIGAAVLVILAKNILKKIKDPNNAINADK